MKKTIKAIWTAVVGFFTPEQTTPERDCAWFLFDLFIVGLNAALLLFEKTLGARLIDVVFLLAAGRWASVEVVNCARGLLDELYDDLVGERQEITIISEVEGINDEEFMKVFIEPESEVSDDDLVGKSEAPRSL